MKRLALIVVSVLAFASVASAQPRAIGFRAGLVGGEASYQHSIGSNFAEADFGWSLEDIIGTGTFNFPFARAGEFTFYAGPGAYLKLLHDGGLDLGIVGQVGAEFSFDIPLNISLDWRPSLSFIPGTASGWEGFAFGLRYRF